MKHISLFLFAMLAGYATTRLALVGAESSALFFIASASFGILHIAFLVAEKYLSEK